MPLNSPACGQLSGVVVVHVPQERNSSPMKIMGIPGEVMTIAAASVVLFGRPTGGVSLPDDIGQSQHVGLIVRFGIDDALKHPAWL